ncbi:MAG: acyl carrier protein [Terracidiphilus sp.]
MLDQEERLLRCFSSIFPSLTQEEIENATAETVGTWDSLSTVTLAAVIQEEFDVEIDPDALPDLDSYQAFRNYLSPR